MNKNFSIEKVLEFTIILILIAGIDMVGNLVGYKTPFSDTIEGMFILFAVGFVGLLLTQILPFNIPSIVYISIIGLVVALPFFPGSSYVIEVTSKVNMLTLATPVLAYSGITMGKNWAEFKRMGWKGIIVTMCVMIGTFVGSAIIAHIVLKAQGMI